MSIPIFLKDVFTGIDGESFDIGRILWGLGVVVFLGIAIGDFVINQKFDPISFGAGFGATLAGGGAALGMKAKTEPAAEEK